MAPVSFHFISGSGALQGIDARVKLLAAVGLSVSAYYADVRGMALLTLLLAACAWLSAIPLAALLRETRVFAFVGAIVFLGVALTTPGETAGPLPFVTVEGLKAGALVAWRLLLLVVLGAVLTASTSVEDIRRSVERILAPIPLVPERRVAFLMSMTVAILPMISDTAAEVSDAQRSRCSDLHRNPVRKIRNLTLPLLMQLFRKADEIGDAMESRGFDPDSSPAPRGRRRLRAKDYGAVLCAAAAFAAVIILRG